MQVPLRCTIWRRLHKLVIPAQLRLCQNRTVRHLIIKNRFNNLISIIIAFPISMTQTLILWELGVCVIKGLEGILRATWGVNDSIEALEVKDWFTNGGRYSSSSQSDSSRIAERTCVSLKRRLFGCLPQREVKLEWMETPTQKKLCITIVSTLSNLIRVSTWNFNIF